MGRGNIGSAGVSVCVFDANAISRERTRAALTARGYDVVAVASAADLVAKGETRDFELLVFDASAPMSGEYAIAAIRSLDVGGCPILLYADRTEAQLSELAAACNAQHHVRKVSGGADALVALVERVAPVTQSASLSLHLRDSQRQRARASTASRDAWRHLRVLLVDDSEVILTVLEARLAEDGFDVRIALAPAEIDSITRGWRPDVVVADVNMPEIRGDHLCARLKQRIGAGKVAVVLFSSLGDAELEKLAKAAGADGFVSKEHGIEHIAAKIRSLCESLTQPLVSRA